MLITCEFCRMKLGLREVCAGLSHRAGCNPPETTSVPCRDLAHSQLSMKTIQMNHTWKMEAEAAIRSIAITSGD